MLRTQQGSKGEVADALPKAGPSGLYSFQYVGASPANAWGMPCMRDRSACSLGCALLLGCATVFLLIEIASRPLPVRHWSGACGRACQQLKGAQVCCMLPMAHVLMYAQQTRSEAPHPRRRACCAEDCLYHDALQRGCSSHGRVAPVCSLSTPEEYLRWVFAADAGGHRLLSATPSE